MIECLQGTVDTPGYPILLLDERLTGEGVAFVGRCLEFAATDGNEFTGYGTDKAAERDNITSSLMNRVTRVPSKVRDGFNVGCSTTQQPQGVQMTMAVAL